MSPRGVSRSTQPKLRNRRVRSNAVFDTGPVTDVVTVTEAWTAILGRTSKSVSEAHSSDASRQKSAIIGQDGASQTLKISQKVPRSAALFSLSGQVRISALASLCRPASGNAVHGWPQQRGDALVIPYTSLKNRFATEKAKSCSRKVEWGFVHQGCVRQRCGRARGLGCLPLPVSGHGNRCADSHGVEAGIAEEAEVFAVEG